MHQEKNNFVLRQLLLIFNKMSLKKERKGVSDIVITLIVVLISLAAIGIVGVVINNIIKGNVKNVEFAGKCLNINIESTKATCQGGPQFCDITLSRTGTESIPITGVKVIARTNVAGQEYNIDVLGDVPLLQGKSFRINTNILQTTTITKLEFTPFFIDDKNEYQFCPQTTSFTF